MEKSIKGTYLKWLVVGYGGFASLVVEHGGPASLFLVETDKNMGALWH